jgi:hypothetical protein
MYTVVGVKTFHLTLHAKEQTYSSSVRDDRRDEENENVSGKLVIVILIPVFIHFFTAFSLSF